MNPFAASFAPKFRGSATKKLMPLSLHTAVITFSYPSDFGSGPMKSSANDSNGLVGIGRVFAVPAGF